MTVHNNARRLCGQQDLKWDNDLAAQAARYAQKCLWRHSDSRERPGSG